MDDPRLRLERRGAVLYATLDRPAVRNAFDEETIRLVTEAFEAAGKDAALRAIVLAGAGKDFCAGADIHWMRRAAGLKPAQSRKDAMRLVGMCRAVDACPVPVVTRVHGACFGGALGVAAASDFVVCADDAVMAFSECRLGIVPAVVSSFVIPKIGESHARRLFLTAESFGPALAQRIGLVHEVCPAAELDAKVETAVGWILKAGPQAVREAKALIRKVSGLPMARKVAVTTATLARVRASAEARDGFAAFLEKRPAPWVPSAAPAKANS